MSCGEDGTLRVWRSVLFSMIIIVYRWPCLFSFLFCLNCQFLDGSCVQTVRLPAVSVWSVSVMDNGDIVTGSR